MNALGTPRPARCLAVWGATTAAVVLVSLWSAPDLPVVAGPGRATFDVLLVRGCALALVLCASWWWFVTTIVVLEALRVTDLGARTGRGVPDPARRWVLAACGVAVVSSSLSPAHATPGSVQRDDRPRSGATTVEGLPLPERPSGGLVSPVGAQRDHSTRQPAPALVVVRPGDSLWHIAATALGPGADVAAVSSYWRRIHRLNDDVVGADPDLIRPGQQLLLPTRPVPPRGES